MSQPEPVFRIKHEGTTWEIYLLDPGQTFPKFGGSSTGLLVKKTASLIVRETTPSMQTDNEFDLNDEKAWNWIRRLLKDYWGQP